MPVPASSPSEFAFELVPCVRLERTIDWLPARQPGVSVASPGSRIIDVRAVISGPGFDDRTRITDRVIPTAVIESGVEAGNAVFQCDGFNRHPGRAQRVVDCAVKVGLFESEHRRNGEYVRRAARYPDDWFARLVGIENKPDLGSPGDPFRQPRLDVSLAVSDEVILTTESYTTGTHLNRIPEEVSVWCFGPDTDGHEMVRKPHPLSSDSTDVESVEYHLLRTDVTLVSLVEKRTARFQLVGHAYGKGWHAYDLPGYAHARVDADGRSVCDYFGHVVDPGSECGPDYLVFEAANPPELDRDGPYGSRTDWVADPPGAVRRQSGLDQYR